MRQLARLKNPRHEQVPRSEAAPEDFAWARAHMEAAATTGSLSRQRQAFDEVLTDERADFASAPMQQRVALLRSLAPETMSSLTRQALGIGRKTLERMQLLGDGGLAPHGAGNDVGPAWQKALAGLNDRVESLLAGAERDYLLFHWRACSVAMRRALTLQRLALDDTGSQATVGLYLARAAQQMGSDDQDILDLGAVIAKADSATLQTLGEGVLEDLMRALAERLGTDNRASPPVGFPLATKILKVWRKLWEGERLSANAAALYEPTGEQAYPQVRGLWRRFRHGLRQDLEPQPVRRSSVAATSTPWWRYTPGTQPRREDTEGHLAALRKCQGGELHPGVENLVRRLFDDRVIYFNLPRGRSVLLVGDRARTLLGHMVDVLGLPTLTPIRHSLLTHRAGESVRNTEALFRAARQEANRIGGLVVVSLVDCHEMIRERSMSALDAYYKMETAAFLQAFGTRAQQQGEVLVWCSTTAVGFCGVDTAWASRCGTVLAVDDSLPSTHR